MEWFVRRFMKSSLSWLAAGATLGLVMAIWPTTAVLRTAHLHINLLGFVAMMIFGVAYHVIPRFTGHELYSRRLAGAHWWMSNVGLALFATGFGLRGYGITAGTPLVAVGGLASASGAYMFVYGMWRTIDGPRALRAAQARAAAAARHESATRVPTEALRRPPVSR